MLAFFRRHLWCLALACLLGGEFLLFDQVGAPAIAHAFPRWTDQAQYLEEAYGGYESITTHGFREGLIRTAQHPVAQGKVHEIAGALVLVALGQPSRSALLSLNLLVFLAWQAVLALVVARAAGSRSLAFAAAGLLLCLRWPWQAEPASAFDFRLDHAAMCLMGAASALALATRGFRARGASVAFGVVVGLAIAERFLTATYFGVILAGYVSWSFRGSDRARRIRHLLLAAIVAAAIAAPALWLDRQAAYNYYWLGHMHSAEGDVRAAMSLGNSLDFLLSHLLADQLGLWFLAVATVFAAMLVHAMAEATVSRPHHATDYDGWFTGLIFTAVPFIVLALHRQKSAFVVGALVPGVIVILVESWRWLWARIDPGPGMAAVTRQSARIYCAAVLAAGLGYFTWRQLATQREAFTAESREIARLADCLARESQLAGLSAPRLGTNEIADYLDARSLAIYTYERHRKSTLYIPALPAAITEEADATVMQRLAQCDFVLLADTLPGHGVFPFDRQMRRLQPAIKQWCTDHLAKVDTFFVFGRKITLFRSHPPSAALH